MEGIIQMLYGVLASPVPTFRRVAKEAPVGVAIVILVLSSLVSAMSSATDAPWSYAGMGMADAFLMQFGTRILVALVGIALVYLASGLFGGTGRFAAVFSAIAFAQFPGLLNGPIGLLDMVGVSRLVGLLSFGIGAWTLVLSVLALRESRGLTTGKSVLSYFLAMVVIAAISAAIFLSTAIMVVR